MPPPTRNVALSLGVSDPERLPFLGGALRGAQDFHHWATQLGYESTLLTDAPDPITSISTPVTMQVVADTLNKILLAPNQPPIHRFLLYFAGHGLIQEAEQGLWFLSDWDTTQRIVSVERLKRRLYLYGIDQIAIFSDACRSVPDTMNTLDLTVDPILGKGPRPLTPAAVDKFIAAQDGKEAWSVPGETPEEDRCIFTGVLMQGLWGIDPTAFSHLLPGRVTSSSLGGYLQKMVPNKAKEYNRDLNPSVAYGFPDHDNIYFGDEPKPPAPPFPAWPPKPRKGIGAAIGFTLGQGIERVITNLVLGDLAPKALAPLGAGMTRKPPSLRIPPDFHFQYPCGLKLDRYPIDAIWTTDQTTVQGEPISEWDLQQGDYPGLNTSAPLLVEFDPDTFLAMTAMPFSRTYIIREWRGVAALFYRSIYEGEVPSLLTQQVLSEMDSKPLRASRIQELATELRTQKHADPVLGVLAAYLYDSIGDIDNIRRMAYYYVGYGQPIPYDIALLAQIPSQRRGDELWAYVPPVPESPHQPAPDPKTGYPPPDWTYRKTTGMEGRVGGLWPWMRQGWDYLEDATDVEATLIAPELHQVRDHLIQGRFTTVNQTGAQLLATTFNLHRVEPTASNTGPQAAPAF